MKIKWLVVLFIVFLGVIFFSLLVTQQIQDTVSLTEKEAIINNQSESHSLPNYSSPVTPVAAVAATSSLGKSGITIIKAPAVEPVVNNLRVSQEASKPAINLTGGNVVANTVIKDSSPAGITKIGKRPDAKQAQEMNSSGVVMY